MRPVPGEEWTVGVVLDHIAESHGKSEHWLDEMARGEGVPDTAEEIDRANAAHAVRAASVTPAETVAHLTETGHSPRDVPAGPQRRGSRLQCPVRTGRGPGLSDGRPGGGTGPPHA